MDEKICHTCHLVAVGYTAEELGLEAEHNTPAVHFVISAEQDPQEFHDRCDFCEELSTVVACSSEPFAILV